MATLKDVARLAGVSTTTVSHALNGTRHVQPETAAKVLSAVKELGYSLNSVARGLRTRSSHTLGVIGPSPRDPFFAEAMSGIEDVCFARGYEVYSGYAECPHDTGPVVIAPTERDFLETVMSGRFDAPLPAGPNVPEWEKEEELIAHMLAREVDGLILNPWRPDQVLLNALRGVPSRVSLFHRRVEGLEADVFGSDDYAGTARALQELLALGHRRIGMVYGTSFPGHGARGRFRAYHDSLVSAGIPVDLDLLVNGGYFPLRIPADATRSLLALRDPPTAILYWGDYMAIAGLDAARHAGVAVPAELSIIGFDDHQISEHVCPRLSTIHQEKLEMGAAMAARLIDRIEGKYHGPSEHVVSPTRYIRRESVGPAPVSPSAR